MVWAVIRACYVILVAMKGKTDTPPVNHHMDSLASGRVSKWFYRVGWMAWDLKRQMDDVFVALAKENKSYMGTVDGMDPDTWMS